MEDDTIVDDFLGDFSEFHDSLSDDSEITLATQDKLVEIWSRRQSRDILESGECTDGGDDFDTLNNIINISVSILLHSTGSSGDPASECRKFD